jgi:putative Mg2+ transporter-C (MgtC) family protein
VEAMTVAEIVIRMLVAAVFGGLIGVEREFRDQAAGFRTHILVSVGSAAFTLASVYGFEEFVTGDGASNASFDPSRVAAQIVAGVGFLGAGAILRHGATVRGLTTAASLWAVAAIGMASGLGRYDLAVATTVVVIVSLYLLRFIEHMLIRPRAHERMKVEIRFRERGFGPLTSLIDTLDAAHIIIHKMSADETDPSANTVHMELELPKGMIPADVVRLISQGPAVEGVAQG